MGYIDKILSDDEQVVYRATISKIVYFPALLAVIFWVAMYSVDLGPFIEPRKGILSLLLLAYAILSALLAFIKQCCTEMAVTDRRVIAKFGLVARRSYEIPKERIESIEVDQSILGRIFNFGTIMIKGTGSGHVPIPTVDDPVAFQQAIGKSGE